METIMLDLRPEEEAELGRSRQGAASTKALKLKAWCVGMKKVVERS